MFGLICKKMLFTIPEAEHDAASLRRILSRHPEVRFVSFAGVDMCGNDTDERIPIKYFLDNLDDLLSGGVQTDGSSVNLPKIAELNNAKVDLKPDASVNWYVDYNFENWVSCGAQGDDDGGKGGACDGDGEGYCNSFTELPAGTLRIPSYLIHNDKTHVGSRVILRDAVAKFKKDLMELLEQHPYVLECFEGVSSAKDIDEIIVTGATELEFWVRTPDDRADREQLHTSQELKEQYWKRTYGPVRTALEESIDFLNEYGIGMEMGHKEMGGVKSKITKTGEHDHIMEQLEIDWRYTTAMQVADNEKLVKYAVRDVFNQYGLNTTFMAKPIAGVAGNGEHTHLGVCARLKDGRVINLFAPQKFGDDFVTPIGYGAIMGILRNYEAINPFVSSSTDALNRLKPGFEAPVSVVTSLGNSPKEPSRNRTVLIGLVREVNNPMATRFELRSPNPKSNTYLVIASCCMAMLDGIRAVLNAEKSGAELEKSLSKNFGEEDFYLERDREYRTEKDVFADYSEEERERLYGKAPATVWEVLQGFERYPEKTLAVCGRASTEDEGVINELSLESYKLSILNQWKTELHSRLIPNYRADVRECSRKHGEQGDGSLLADIDIVNWDRVEKEKAYIAKDSLAHKSLLTRLEDALESGDYDKASDLQIELQERIEELKNSYLQYRKNLI